ncbi:MAG: branched-chain amino acid ABC transporter permease [Solirubrobacterales bacterium]
MEEFLTATVRGLSQGSLYALLGLGFVIIFKGTGVVSFAQPVLMTLGAYLVSALAVDSGVPFFAAALLAVAGTALIAMAIERTAMRPMVGEPVFSAAMVTVGVFIALQVIVADLIGSGQRSVGDPWGLERFDVGGVVIFHTDIVRWVVAAAVVVGLTLCFRYARWGLAMRATAFSQETVLAQGVPVGRMFSLSWGIGGGLAALAGVLVGMGGAGFDQATTLLALKALPAIILGGLDSVRGAVIGGLAIGLAEAYTKVYQPEFAPWLGSNFDQVVPYLLMLLVLLVRPYGLYGTPEVQRI